jgi:hypothetical protein
MTVAEAGAPRVQFKQHAVLACRVVLTALFIWLWATPSSAQLVACRNSADLIASAVARVRSSIDPCGESVEVQQILDTVERCVRNTYEVCADTEIARNVFDRPVAHRGETPIRTITWNPELTTELETTCAGDPTQPLLRDPTASLLHELVHAAQDCGGLNPGEHELEAVRVENIYRRAAGLCERSGYGEELLPASMMASCSPRPCSCSTPTGNDVAPEPPDTTMARAHTIDSREGEGMNGIAVQTSGDRPAR